MPENNPGEVVDVDAIEPPWPCPHCGGGPDSAIVRKRVVSYEYHRPDCVVLNDGAGR